VEVTGSQTAKRVHDTVAQYAAHLVTEMVEPHSTIGLAWGFTVSAVVSHLRPHPVRDVSVVQLNGAGDRRGLRNSYASDIVSSFAQNFSGADYPFPVPAFFDYPETKTALWRERSIRQILAVQQRADLLLFSTGAAVGDLTSYVYSAGYLSEIEVAALRAEGVIGDIATVYFGGGGSEERAINSRSSGPPLQTYLRASRAVCVSTGSAKVPGLVAALRAGLITDLVVDELTAAELSRLRPHAPPGHHQSGQSTSTQP
jgi:DNA-binding transcriptional regulator LsrR (DeoR family)